MSAAKKDQLPKVLLGMLCGIIAVPVGCFVSGLIRSGKVPAMAQPLSMTGKGMPTSMWSPP